MKKLIFYEFRNMWTQLTIVAVTSLIIISTLFTFVTFLNSDTAFTSSGTKIQGIASYQAIRQEMEGVKGKINQDYLNRYIYLHLFDVNIVILN